jgi:hypothetical protein
MSPSPYAAETSRCRRPRPLGTRRGAGVVRRERERERGGVGLEVALVGFRVFEEGKGNG